MDGIEWNPIECHRMFWNGMEQNGTEQKWYGMFWNGVEGDDLAEGNELPL